MPSVSVSILLPHLVPNVNDHNGAVTGSRDLSTIVTNFFTIVVSRVGAAKDAFVCRDVIKVTIPHNSNAPCTRHTRHIDPSVRVLESTHNPNGAISGVYDSDCAI